MCRWSCSQQESGDCGAAPAHHPPLLRLPDHTTEADLSEDTLDIPHKLDLEHNDGEHDTTD